MLSAGIREQRGKPEARDSRPDTNSTATTSIPYPKVVPFHSPGYSTFSPFLGQAGKSFARRGGREDRPHPFGVLHSSWVGWIIASEKLSW